MKKKVIKGIPLGEPKCDTGFEECDGVRYANTCDFRMKVLGEHIEYDSKGNQRRVVHIKLIDLRDTV